MSKANSLYYRLDESDLTKRHISLYSVVILGHLFDGFEINMIGVILAGIIATFKITSEQAGLLGSSVFFGMALGSSLIGFVVDKFGRKKGLIFSIAMYSVFSLFCGLSTSYSSLLAFRVLQGIGLGAEIPVMFTYLSEFMPTKYRGRLLASSVFFWQAASVLVSLIAMVLVPAMGWRSMFFVGLIPAIIVTIVWSFVPESVRFLVSKGKYQEAENIVDKFSTISGDESVKNTKQKQEGTTKKVPISVIFKGKYSKLTIGIWIMQFIIGFVFFGLAVWLPSMLFKMGIGFVHSLSFLAVITGAGAIGNVVGGILSDKKGSRFTLTSFMSLGGVFLLLCGLSTNPLVMLIFGILAAFFGFGGGGGVLLAYTSSLYPTDIRATGTGWAAFWQRIGGIIAPYALGILLGMKLPVTTFFISLAILFLISGVTAYFMTFELSKKSLEQIDQELSM